MSEKIYLQNKEIIISNNLERYTHVPKEFIKSGILANESNVRDMQQLLDVYTAANFTKHEDSFTQLFTERNIAQYWRPEEIAVSNDLICWNNDVAKEEKETFSNVLAGLSLLDTQQGNLGMPIISLTTPGHQRKALLNFMGMAESLIHVPTYSNIFITLLSIQDIDDLFKWVEQNKFLRDKIQIITEAYLLTRLGDPESTYKAKVMSVGLESLAFYTGFYYPLYLAGQSRMVASGESINLIIRDESIHGVYVGLLAQEEFKNFSPAKQKELEKWTRNKLDNLIENEFGYAEQLYDTLGLASDVKNFVLLNANSTLENLGFEGDYKHDAVSQTVVNGLNTETKSMDLFSTKGNGYVKPKIEELKEEDFDFSNY